MINLEYSSHPVVEVRTIHGSLFELAVERNGLDFTPGDCVAIYTGDGKSRPYSIASGSGEDELRFVIRKMDGGEVSPWLMDRRPGDVIRIPPPFGWFPPGKDIGGAPFVFLATGTVFAPFLSYIQSFDNAPAACLYGVRHAADAHGLDQFMHRCPTLLAVSREPASGHHHGRITDLLDAIPLDETTHCYCCGLESMVNETTAWLQVNGIRLAQIHREVFFHG